MIVGSGAEGKVDPNPRQAKQPNVNLSRVNYVNVIAQAGEFGVQGLGR